LFISFILRFILDDIEEEDRDMNVPNRVPSQDHEADSGKRISFLDIEFKAFTWVY
jgi:hypothetical protein